MTTQLQFQPLLAICAVVVFGGYLAAPTSASGALVGSINGGVTAIADQRTQPNIRDTAIIPDEEPAVAFAADIFGIARGEADYSLFNFGNAVEYDFHGDAYASSVGFTSPIVILAVEFHFIAETPVYVSAQAHVDGLSSNLSRTTVYLRNATTGTPFLRAGPQGFYGLTQDQPDATFNDWLQPGNYELRVDLQVSLDPALNETYRATGYNGSITVSTPEPTSALLLLFGASICLQRRTLRRT